MAMRLLCPPPRCLRLVGLTSHSSSLCHSYMYDHESVPYSAVQSIADVCCQALSPEVAAASQASIVVAVVTSGVIMFACTCGPLSVSSSVCEMRVRPRVHTS